VSSTPKYAILVAVVMLLAVTVLLSWLVRGQRDFRSPESCVSILRQIDGAKSSWALEHNKKATDTPTDSDLFGPNAYIRTKPACPQGGVYTIGSVGHRPQCSLPMHSIDFGWVIVCDEMGAPVEGADVSVLGSVPGAEQVRTDTNGLARVTRFATSVSDEWARSAIGIAASRSGFQSTTSTFPTPWPVRVALKRDTR
jgi:hypothetical protein